MGQWPVSNPSLAPAALLQPVCGHYGALRLQKPGRIKASEQRENNHKDPDNKSTASCMPAQEAALPFNMERKTCFQNFHAQAPGFRSSKQTQHNLAICAPV